MPSQAHLRLRRNRKKVTMMPAFDYAIVTLTCFPSMMTAIPRVFQLVSHGKVVMFQHLSYMYIYIFGDIPYVTKKIYICFLATLPSWNVNSLAPQKSWLQQVYLERLITDLQEATLVAGMHHISSRSHVATSLLE